MALSDIIAADVTGVFLNGDFDQVISYTPQGGQVKSIRAQVYEDTDEVFGEGNDVLDFDTIEIEINSESDATGQITPKELGRNAQAGDTLILPNDLGVTWYVIKILANGHKSGSKMHRLLIRNKAVPMD